MVANNNCLDVINWPNQLRVIKVIKFTKAKGQYNSQTVKEKTQNRLKIEEAFYIQIIIFSSFSIHGKRIVSRYKFGSLN